MKIGASTLAGIEFDLEKSLEFIESLGLDYAELVHQYPAERIDKDLLESYNLKYSIHAPFMDVNIASPQDQSRLNSIKQIESSIDLANEVDAEAVVVHPGTSSFLASKYFKKEVYEFSNRSIKEIGDYANDLGVMATIENMPNFDTMIYQDIHALNELLEEYEMYMTLDIGHANHAGYSTDEIIFDSIKHVHAHDNDAQLPLGEGNIKLNDIINSLESKNYKGIYILEVNDFDSIKKSYEYMKKNF